MQRIFELIQKRTEELLADGTANRVIGWQPGEFFYDQTPTVFDRDTFANFVYDGFCGSNLSKYLIAESKKEGKIIALLKPCDTYSFNQLLKEHRIDRDNVYVLGIPCHGMLDIEKIRGLGVKGIKSIEEKGDELHIKTLYGEKVCKRQDVLLEKCLCCKGMEHVAFDEVIEDENPMQLPAHDRFELVEKLEQMTPDERFEFWRGELSKCIRCNACRNVCPACSCVKCVFDNDQSGIASKANTDTFEENMFHIIRAFHVAGRCTDCGECSRVCPQHIPLHLLNRKFIKDINELYGEYQAGADLTTTPPLTSYTTEDAEPSIVLERGGGQA
jgi:formate dehydrogenase subunit beta